MKKIVITLFLVLFTSSVYAGSCPMMVQSLDDKIAEAQTLRDQGSEMMVQSLNDKIAKAQTLRDQGKAAHDAGDHAKSEGLLNKAMELFKS